MFIKLSKLNIRKLVFTVDKHYTAKNIRFIGTILYSSKVKVWQIIIFF